MNHPMIPSDQYTSCNFFVGLAQDAINAPPHLSGQALHFLCRFIGGFGTVIIPPLHYPSFYTSHAIAHITQTFPKLKDKVEWIAPVVSLGGVTVLSYAAYQATHHIALKAIIFGVHQTWMMIYGRGPSMGWMGCITLDNGIAKLLGVTKKIQTSQYSQNDLVNKGAYSEGCACIAFLISSVALMNMRFNPIINTAISCAAASAVHGIALRALL